MSGRVGATVSGSTSGPVGGSAARRLAEQELARPEYHRSPSVVERIVDAIGRFLSGLLGGVGGGGSDSALFVVGVLILAVVGFAVIRAGRLPGRRQRTGPVDPLAPEAGVDHAARARSLAAAGRHADAMREWLRAAVATLESRDVLDHRPGRTGAEAARAGGLALPGAQAPLAAAAGRFDEVWFGGRPATAADAGLAEQAAAVVRTAAAAGSVR